MKEDDIKKLTFEFNKMLEEENIPEAMKKGWIKLIPKKDKIESHRDIRPITIMNTLYRLLFNIVAFKLRPWANENLNYRQQAFISNRQVNNHIMVLQGLRQRIKKGFVVTNLDIENAYDSVEHQCLEQALKHCKFPKKLMNFILNAYKGHECTIEWNDSLSEPFVKTRGVPQGCPFAPLAYDCITQIIIDKAIDEWNIPIKPSTISPNAIGLKFFADDLSVVGDVNNKYQERIDDVSKWINELHLKINTKKSLMTVIPHRKHPDFQIKINGENVPRTDNQRTLGNYLTEDSSFKEEIKRRILKIQQLLQLMPIHLIEPRNLNQITMSKTISSFTHIIRGNPVSRTLLQGIDRTIRKQCRKLLQIDMRTSKASLYLPIEKGGLNIPNIELFSKLITIKTIQYQGHSNNCLVKKAVVQSLQNCKKCKTKNLNYWENVWDICNENNLKIIFGRSDHRFKTPKAHKKEREIAIWTDGSRSKDGTGIGILIQSSNATTCHKYKLDPRYTHNMAELSAVVTSLKLIPSSSSVTITTDSEIAQKIFTNNNYRGQFIQLKREYEATIQDKKLKVTIEWVKGHDKCQENNFVDKLAKNASTKGKFLDPKNLFTQEQLLIIKDSLWIPNPCRIIRNNWLSQISENSQVTNLVSDTTFRYIEGKSTPHHKYSIWRNLNFCHVRSFKQHICPECNVPLSHEHLILQCPLLQFQRKWAIDNIKKHTNRDPILVSTESDHLNNYKFYLNYKGILQHNTTMDSISLFHREWFNIQSTLSLLAGHAHTQYWKIVQ